MDHMMGINIASDPAANNIIIEVRMGEIHIDIYDCKTSESRTSRVVSR
jgi:hypothetical protein